MSEPRLWQHVGDGPDAEPRLYGDRLVYPGHLYVAVDPLHEADRHVGPDAPPLTPAEAIVADLALSHASFRQWADALEARYRRSTHRALAIIAVCVVVLAALVVFVA